MTKYIQIANNAVNISRQRFGRLVALGPIGREGAHITWECQCDCGNLTTVPATRLRRGTSQSCGCWQKELAAQRTKTHGMTKHPLFNGWQQMNGRCANPKARGYAYWGGRGIKVCDEWRESFETFHNYVTRLPGYGTPGFTLDRIDNDGDYKPSNVRWASSETQNRNSRNTRYITHNGRTKCLTEWASEKGLSPQVLGQRLARGWTAQRALNTPIRGKSR